MAKIWQISDGRSYVVNGDPGTTITYTNSPSNGTAAGKPVTSIPTGATSVTFPSNGSEVEISSDTATIDQVFNAAAAGSGSSSSGSGSAGGVTFQIVTTLPSQGAAGVIYLVKVSETGDDKFEEWIWVDSAWESIGTTAVDPTTYAKLIGGNTFEGNQVINGDLTVTGDVSGVTESNYNVVETTETTITPTGGTWVRYTGTATSLTVVEPGWDGEAEISYLETTTPVDLQGVTWSPAKPILTGNGPFVYALVHSREGEILAGAYGYSTPTAEAIQAVAPIAWVENTATPLKTSGSVAIGSGAKTVRNNVAIGLGAEAWDLANSIGYGSFAGVAGQSFGNRTNTGDRGVAIGHYAKSGSSSSAIGAQSESDIYSVSLGACAKASKSTSVTIGAQFSETVNGQNVINYCTTEGTGSITIGAGANTINTTTTVNGVETTVESSNSVTIGCKASNSGADSVVIGARAKNSGSANVFIGVYAQPDRDGDVQITAVGRSAHSYNYGTAIGYAARGGSWGTAVGYSASSGTDAVAAGRAANATDGGTAISASAKAKKNRSIAVGINATADAAYSIVIGSDAAVFNTGSTQSENTTVIGAGTAASAPTALTFGAAFSDTEGSYTCTTEGTGSITIGAGANTKNTTTTVDGVETTVESSNAITIGCKASNSGADSVVIGAQASNTGSGAVLIGGKNVGNGSTILVGNNINANSYNSVISLGFGNIIGGSLVVAIGRDIQYTKQNAVCVGNYTSAATGSVALGDRASAYAADNTIAIGPSAKITNTGNTPSTSTIVIGANATASAPNAVVMGAGASATGDNSIVIGASGAAVGGVGVGALSNAGQNAVAVGIEAEAHLLSAAFGRKAKAADSYATAVGSGATAVKYAVAAGHGAICSQQNTVALGSSAKAAANRSIAIGTSATVSDLGATVIRSTAEDGTYTQLYFSGANTPLANTYANGEAIMGYVTSDSDGNPLASGFKRLSALFDEGTMTQPATLDENGEWVMPKVFHPSDLDLPIEEEPTEEPEDVTINIPEPTLPEPEPYTPLLVYPLVEPEDVTTNIPEPEPYTPLPVYPIVEPEIPETTGE